MLVSHYVLFSQAVWLKIFHIFNIQVVFFDFFDLSDMIGYEILICIIVDPNEDGYIETPTQNVSLDGYVVTAAALGSSHSLILTSSGLLSFGNNEQGQLGRSGDPSKPGMSGTKLVVFDFHIHNVELLLVAQQCSKYIGSLPIYMEQNITP